MSLCQSLMKCYISVSYFCLDILIDIIIDSLLWVFIFLVLVSSLVIFYVLILVSWFCWLVFLVIVYLFSRLCVLLINLFLFTHHPCVWVCVYPHRPWQWPCEPGGWAPLWPCKSKGGEYNFYIILPLWKLYALVNLSHWSHRPIL